MEKEEGNGEGKNCKRMKKMRDGRKWRRKKEMEEEGNT